MDHQLSQRPDPPRTRHPRRLAIAAIVAAMSATACGAGTNPTPTTSAPSAAATAADPTGTPVPTNRSPSPTPGVATAPSSVPRNPAVLDGSVPYRPSIDPAGFTTTIDNPFMPLVPGTTFIYEGAGERVEVTVTSDTRQVMGVETVVVRDTATVKGKVIEDTSDWFAQDRAGNVWYFGEATKSFEDDPAGDPAGSWEAGVDGAQPGIVMLADPQGGDVYRQEFYAGEAEDLALVRQLDDAIKVRAGSFDGVLVTEEWTPLEPDHIEHKFYARGVGLVGERVIAGGNEKVDLVEVRQPGA